LDGVLHLDVHTLLWNGGAILPFVEQLLTMMNPFPGKNFVLVMDNAPCYCVPGL
ncbi:hypothetical protein BC835DRAFT_1245041, partial [Cytidiella melzeri]